MFRLTRRDFLRAASSAALATLFSRFPEEFLAFEFIEPIEPSINPLEQYPNRGWENIYRDIYSPDSSFVFLCAPNCTFICLLRAYSKGGYVLYVDPTYGYGEATDIYGNKVSHRWDPMTCATGAALPRRVYSPRRVKGAYVREGFYRWYRDGFPRDPITGLPPQDYFSGRGREGFIRVSWDEAFEIIARALINIASTYSGEDGQKKLRLQGYPEEMIRKQAGCGVSTIKLRGGMPLCGVFRIAGAYRFANMLALLDAYIRKVDPGRARGARGWDNYAWHTDLPPGHPMVTGYKTFDWHLSNAENADVVVIWGMNWISTKMAAASWLTEARERGVKVVVISMDYQATANKADYVLIVRPGSDTALALGFIHVIIKERLYDEDYIKKYTDLPLLVRLDTLKLLRARDIIPGYRPHPLKNNTRVTDEAPPPPYLQSEVYIPSRLREEIDDFVVWDLRSNSPKVITRDHIGRHLEALGIDPALEGEYEVETVDGKRIKVATVFELIKRYVIDNFDPKTVSEITEVPEEAVVEVARLLANHRGRVLIATGMGVNQFYHGDLKDRAVFLLASLVGCVGKISGSVGSYAGNFKLDLLNGISQYIAEDPFNIELDPSKPARVKTYWEPESAHYYAYGDRILAIGNRVFTGWSHIPTPTKAMIFANSNSILGNAKWAYNIIVNTLPKIELIVTLEWFWTLSCEYSDIVLGVDSWLERKLPDIALSTTTPFIASAVRTPMKKVFDTRDDLEVWAGIAKKLSEITGDKRFEDYWRFVYENKVEVYINRVLSMSSSTRGLTFEELDRKSSQGIPYVYHTRTTPIVVGFENTAEDIPFHTKTGRLEFYREEDEFIAAGENLPVYREPIDGTPYEPNVIVAKPHPAIRPIKPEDLGIDPNNTDQEVRQVRNVVKPWDMVKTTKHPLARLGYTHVLPSPKHRGLIHTFASGVDIDAVVFTPFADPYRRDPRMPWIAEGYVEINPLDGKRLGIDDGDYILVEGDPNYLPFIGRDKKGEDYKAFRWVARAKYNPSLPPGYGKVWFNFYMASHGTVEGHEKRRDRLAMNPRTLYISSYRYGGHQSVVRTWLKPTLMTDSLVRKTPFLQVLGKGFALDMHSPVGAPRESFVKLVKLEAGGIDGKDLWPPAKKGYRPGYESEDMLRYLRGDFVEVE
ncbi:MAG: molybdopterin-dependent oxidoreductase [Sulfolobales archaeon]